MKQRALLKLSGEALLGDKDYGVDANVVKRIGEEIANALPSVQVALVVGAGNIFRGVTGVAETGMQRATADGMGMLATVMNALALKDGFEALGLPVRVLSAIPVGGIAERYQRDEAIRALSAGEIVILPGGTSNPYFTTDSAAVLRALETNCKIVLKGTKVDGVYTADPKKNPSAKKYDTLTYAEAIQKELKIMDLSAFALAKENALPIGVFDMTRPGAIADALIGKNIGTIVKD